MKNSESKMMSMMYRLGLDYNQALEILPTLLTLRRLANKQHKLAEMDCNGEGVVRGRFYSCSPYHSLKSAASAYLDKDGEKTIFTAESNKVEAKIQGICDRLGLRVEFQGDPRGYTVKVFKGDRFLDIQG